MSNSPVATLNLRWSANPSGGLATDGDMAQTSITGTETNCEGIGTLSYQVKWAATGTPIGVLSFEQSNNYDRDTGTGDWVPCDSTRILGLSSCHPAGTAGSHLITIGTDVFQGRWIRIKYTRTSGTGTINAWVFGS